MAIVVTDAAARGISHDGVPTTFPAGSILEIRSGAPPGPSAAPTGTLISTIVLPAGPWAAAALRATPKQGVWEQANATAGGVAAHFRLKTAADTGAATQNEARLEGTRQQQAAAAT
jgi:hypothetical protein